MDQGSGGSPHLKNYTNSFSPWGSFHFKNVFFVSHRIVFSWKFLTIEQLKGCKKYLKYFLTVRFFSLWIFSSCRVASCFLLNFFPQNVQQWILPGKRKKLAWNKFRLMCKCPFLAISGQVTSLDVTILHEITLN